MVMWANDTADKRFKAIDDGKYISLLGHDSWVIIPMQPHAFLGTEHNFHNSLFLT